MPHDRPGLQFSNRIFCSCRISTDKRVARSLCHSRATCSDVAQCIVKQEAVLLQRDCATSLSIEILQLRIIPFEKRLQSINDLEVYTQSYHNCCFQIDHISLPVSACCYVRHYSRDPTFSRFDTVPECHRHKRTHTHTHAHIYTDRRTDKRRRHIRRLAQRRAVKTAKRRIAQIMPPQLVPAYGQQSLPERGVIMSRDLF